MRHSNLIYTIPLIFLSISASAAPMLVSKTADNFVSTIPFGSSSSTNDTQLIPVLTLGPEFRRDFIHTSSFLTGLDVAGDGFARWGGGNWPEGTTGSITVTFEFGVFTQNVDGTAPGFNPDFSTATEFFPYECEEMDGCPAGDPDLGFGSFNVPLLSSLTVSSPGREVSQASAVTQVDLSRPEHGSGQLTVSGNFLIEQRYEARSDKLFAEFLSDTASQFGDTLEIISLSMTGGGTTRAEIAANFVVMAADPLLSGDTCATSVASAAVKEFIASRIERLGTGAVVPGANIVATASLAAGVTSIISNCLAEDPPDFDVTSVITPDELFAGIDIPPLIEGAAGEALSDAIERDLKVALALAAALDAFERFQGAELLGDEIAREIQIENYLELMGIANSLSEQSMTFYQTDAEDLFVSAGLFSDFDIQQAIAVLELIDVDFIMTVLNLTDEAQIAVIMERFDKLSVLASTPDFLAAPIDEIIGLGDLYDDVMGYTTTDLRSVTDGRIGSEFWESANLLTIDIKPGHKRNRINPRSHGVIWVAVLSDTDPESPFDPSSQVDISTVEFGPDGARPKLHKVKDVNKDGIGDLLLRFKIRKTGIACGDTEATLSGNTFDGQRISGSDSIKTVGCNSRRHRSKEHH